ncbi:MAG: NADPH-dependent oxidoreductase [Rhodospirillaceae bacterium]|nr:NADPH-dependent oxidoreductase [Rhodospirillaceae bacterium]|tara:strand:- start:24584 stop:25417 length:834 start_codon:yes stop_codon:yes gene_type:complete
MATLKELLTERYGKDTGIGDDSEADTAIEALLTRRSIRAYKDEEVPDDLIEVLIACAQSAPSKSNLQQYSIIVVKDQDIRDRLAPWCPRTPGLESKPLLLVFCADMRRNQRVGGFRDRPHVNNNMDTFLNATVDAALAMGYFVTGAEAAGLGTAPLSSLRDNIGEVSEILEIPDGVFPIAGVMAGWPEAPGYVNQRLPQSIVVHRDRYDDSNLEAEIDGYDQTRHNIFPIPDERQTRTDLWGVAEFYGWSEHISRQLGKPERPEFKAFLKSHGFDLD